MTAPRGTHQAGAASASADRARGIARPAGYLAGKVLRVATCLLPRGVSRNRYRREFTAELYGQPPLRQLAYALDLCAQMCSLRTVLVHGTDVTRVPFLCRTNLHHRWRRLANDDGLLFQMCARCGHEKGDLPGTRIDSLFLPMGGGTTNH